MDIFTMGLVLCYVLTGCHPFDETDDENQPDSDHRQSNIKRGTVTYLDTAMQKLCKYYFNTFTSPSTTISLFCFAAFQRFAAKDLIEWMIQREPNSRYIALELDISSDQLLSVVLS